MKRKIIKQGLGGYTIYLPKEWIERKGLKAGEDLEVEEKDSELTIKSDVLTKKSKAITIDDSNRSELKVLLTHYYRNGFDKIIVKDIDDKTSKELRDITQNLLLGFEVTSQEKGTCTIENISEPAGERFDALLRRIFLIIKETQELMIRDFADRFTHMQEMEDYGRQSDKYILFCRRIVVKEKSEQNPVTTWELLTFLTHIQHAHYYLYKYASENRIKKDKNITSMLSYLKDYFDLYYDAYFKKDISYIHEINNKKKKYQFGECIHRIETSSGKNAVVHAYIKEIFRLIQIGSSPILSDLVEKRDMPIQD